MLTITLTLTLTKSIQPRSRLDMLECFLQSAQGDILSFDRAVLWFLDFSFCFLTLRYAGDWAKCGNIGMGFFAMKRELPKRIIAVLALRNRGNS